MMDIFVQIGPIHFAALARKLAVFLITLLFALMTPGLFKGAVIQSVSAQPLQGRTCYDLWYERNAIFANKGHCFKTQQAQSVFGMRCYPPYGQLSRPEQNRVDAIQRQERNIGCRPGGQAATPQSMPPQGAPPQFTPPQGMPPQASRYAGMSCNALWFERNSIFARNGHCFKTARGRAAFGNSCFPPYGRLGSADQRQVDEILGWERRSGCR